MLRPFPGQIRWISPGRLPGPQNPEGDKLQERPRKPAHGISNPITYNPESLVTLDGELSRSSIDGTVILDVKQALVTLDDG
jgi:hypothetical protein